MKKQNEIQDLLSHFLEKLDPEKERGIKKLEETLSDINNMKFLIQYREQTSFLLEHRSLIESRIIDVLENVSVDNIPNWFVNWLREPKKIPYFLHKRAKDKAKDLLVEKK